MGTTHFFGKRCPILSYAINLILLDDDRPRLSGLRAVIVSPRTNTIEGEDKLLPLPQASEGI